jgi:hypothetical protein
MYEDRCVQPRQIYASTVTRRDRRWSRRRHNVLGIAFVSGASLVAALAAFAMFAPGLS